MRSFEEKETQGGRGGDIYCQQAEHNILFNSLKQIQSSNMLHHIEALSVVEVDSTIWKKVVDAEKVD